VHHCVIIEQEEEYVVVDDSDRVDDKVIVINDDDDDDDDDDDYYYYGDDYNYGDSTMSMSTVAADEIDVDYSSRRRRRCADEASRRSCTEVGTFKVCGSSSSSSNSKSANDDVDCSIYDT